MRFNQHHAGLQIRRNNERGMAHAKTSQIISSTLWDTVTCPNRGLIPASWAARSGGKASTATTGPERKNTPASQGISLGSRTLGVEHPPQPTRMGPRTISTPPIIKHADHWQQEHPIYDPAAFGRPDQSGPVNVATLHVGFGIATLNNSENRQELP